MSYNYLFFPHRRPFPVQIVFILAPLCCCWCFLVQQPFCACLYSPAIHEGSFFRKVSVKFDRTLDVLACDNPVQIYKRHCVLWGFPVRVQVSVS